MKRIDVVHGTEEWFEARRGKPTASNFGKIVTSTGKISDSWDKYAYKLAYEAVTGNIEQGYKSDAMQNGNDLEGEARGLYELISGLESEYSDPGIITNDAGTISCSPDGLYPKSGLEIKCPNPETHIGYLVKGVLPTKYKPQVYGCLWLCDVDHWDFFSYHPDLKHFLARTSADDSGFIAYAKKLEEYLSKFLQDVENIKRKIK